MARRSSPVVVSEQAQEQEQEQEQGAGGLPPAKTRLEVLVEALGAYAGDGAAARRILLHAGEGAPYQSTLSHQDASTLMTIARELREAG